MFYQMSKQISEIILVHPHTLFPHPKTASPSQATQKNKQMSKQTNKTDRFAVKRTNDHRVEMTCLSHIASKWQQWDWK